LVLLFLTEGCNKENNINGIVAGKIVSHSDCKNGKSFDQGRNGSCIQYTYSEEEKKLTLSHINAGFNCCPDSLFCKVDLAGDTLVISEFEKDALCNCDCLFDLKIEVTGIEKNGYYVKVIEPYCGDQEKLIFKIDLTNNISGAYCVERKLYPWGM